MFQIVLIVHVLICVCLLVLVLIQQGKGAAVGAAFGSGASNTVFGSRGSGGFLARLTTGMAILFFITSIGLTYLASHLSQGPQASVLTAAAKSEKAQSSGQVKKDVDDVPTSK